MLKIIKTTVVVILTNSLEVTDVSCPLKVCNTILYLEVDGKERIFTIFT